MTTNLVMTQNQYPSLDSIYIIDISIYLDLPREGQTDRCTNCQLKENVYLYTYKAVDQLGESNRQETDR